MRKTKIVATLGPSTDSVDLVRKLFFAGVNVFRLNASHGTQEDHGRRIEMVRQVSAETGIQAGILLDLQGPKIRLGRFENGGCRLEEGSVFTITTEEVMGTPEIASTTYPEFARDVKPGNQVLLADGAFQLEVLSTDGVAARCRVIHGGWISDRKGINLPGVNVSAVALSKKDIADAHFGIKQGVDFIALSFVRTSKDVLRLRHLLDECEAALPIIAKIEKPEAWQNLDSIIEEADGVMVARGDLGVEMALERVPMIQKAIIERCRHYGRFVITATQMLESMIENPLPTRAEVSDIANAIYDGTSALMLSAETSAGRYPIEAVKMMSKIATETEGELDKRPRKPVKLAANPSVPEVISDAAFHVARTAEVTAIVVGTSTGQTARLLARYRPAIPIFAFTSSESVARQLSIIHGVETIIAPAGQSTDRMLQDMELALIRTGRVKPGDNVVFLTGQPPHQSGTTNMLNLHRVSSSL